MKNTYLIILLASLIQILFVNESQAQKITFSNGLSMSSLYTRTSDFLLDDYVTNYSTNIGIQYWDHTYYNLSSELGYIKIGGKNTKEQFDLKYLKYPEEWSFLHLNTSFRLKYPIKSSTVFIGLGPYINIRLDSGKFKNDFFLVDDDLWEIDKVNWGTKFDLGFECMVNRFSYGVTTTYLLPINNLGYLVTRNIYTHTFLFMITLGYKI